VAHPETGFLETGSYWPARPTAWTRSFRLSFGCRRRHTVDQTAASIEHLAYMQIENAKLRQSIVALVVQIAGEDEPEQVTLQII
jgi:hypothetical protein